MKPGHMQLPLLRSGSYFFEERSIIVKMSTSEFDYLTHATRRFCI